MSQIKDVVINEALYNLDGNKKAKLAVLIYSGKGDPKRVLNEAVHVYVYGQSYHELIDANLDNPWMRVILSEINEMHQEPFDQEHHRLGNLLNNGWKNG